VRSKRPVNDWKYHADETIVISLSVAAAVWCCSAISKRHPRVFYKCRFIGLDPRDHQSYVTTMASFFRNNVSELKTSGVFRGERRVSNETRRENSHVAGGPTRGGLSEQAGRQSRPPDGAAPNNGTRREVGLCVRTGLAESETIQRGRMEVRTTATGSRTRGKSLVSQTPLGRAADADDRETTLVWCARCT